MERRKQLLTGALALLILSLFATGMLQTPVYANPLGFHVGDTLILSSRTGVALSRVNGRLTREPASIQLTGVVTAADERSLKFNVVSGTITIGERTYAISSGRGDVAFDGNDALIRVGGTGTGNDGSAFQFRLRGHGEIKGGAIELGLHVGLLAGAQRYLLKFSASIEKL